MRKFACVQLFEKYLCGVSNGRGYREHENPAIRFSENAKAGKYNKLSDECYDTLLQEVKEISAFWLNKFRQQAFGHFMQIMQNSNVFSVKQLQLLQVVIEKIHSIW